MYAIGAILFIIIIGICLSGLMRKEVEDPYTYASPESTTVLTDGLLNYYAFQYDNEDIHETTLVDFNTFVQLNLEGRWCVNA